MPAVINLFFHISMFYTGLNQMTKIELIFCTMVCNMVTKGNIKSCRKKYVRVSALLITTCLLRPRGYKTFFMLNSAEHETLNAHHYENIKKFSIFQAQISLECYFSCS